MYFLQKIVFGFLEKAFKNMYM